MREAIEHDVGAGKPKKGKGRLFIASGIDTLYGTRTFELKDGTARHALRLTLKQLMDAWKKIERTREMAAGDAAAADVPHKVFEPGARGRLILNGVRIREKDLEAAGGTYSLEEVRELMLGVSRQAVEKRVAEGSLLAVPGPSIRRRYPVAQFIADGSIVGGMRSVRQSLPTTNPWSVLNFLVQPDPRLDGRKPIELMRRGEIDLVVEAAKRVGEQGA